MGRAKSSEAGALVLKRGNRRDRGGHNHSAKTGFDGLAEAPWRKTPSIFKQPVILVHTTSSTTTSAPADLNNRVNSSRDHAEYARRQIFWAKSLEGLHSIMPVYMCDRLRRDVPPAYMEQNLNLPSKVENCVDPNIFSGEAACATLCAAIQLNAAGKGPSSIIGQNLPKDKVSDSPLSSINYTQPIVQLPSINEQDIAAQEKRVLDARKRLQELRKSFAIR